MLKLPCPQCKSENDWKAVHAVEAVSGCDIFVEGDQLEIEIEHFQFDAMNAHVVRYTCLGCGYAIGSDELHSLVKTLVRSEALDDLGFKPNGLFRDQLPTETEDEWSRVKAHAEAQRLDRRHAARDDARGGDEKPEHRFLKAFG